MIYLGDKSHACNVCSKTFYTSSALTKHSNIHLPMKPFECEVCLNKFSHKHSLKKHLEAHENDQKIKSKFVAVLRL